jgi:hypothetical protein
MENCIFNTNSTWNSYNTVKWWEWRYTGFGLITGFIGHIYSSWLHFTNHYHTQTSVLSHVAWCRLPTSDLTLLPGSRPRRLATISRQPHTLTVGFSWYFLQLLAPGLNWTAEKVKVTLRPTISRSIRPLCRDPSGSHDWILIILISVWHLLFYRCRAPPLTRGRVCHL